MNILVFGATGKTGQHIVTKLIKPGHSVTAFARNPEKVDFSHGAVKIVQGDAHDAAAIAKAIKGQDVVMTAFGPRSLNSRSIQETFWRNIITGMEAAGVKRLIALSAWGAGDSLAQSTLLLKALRKTLLKNIYDDKDRGEAIVMASGIIYTFLRPGRLQNTPSQGKIKASLTAEGLSQAVSREDVAQFMVAQLSDKTWERKSPLIGYPNS